MWLEREEGKGDARSMVETHHEGHFPTPLRSLGFIGRCGPRGIKDRYKGGIQGLLGKVRVISMTHAFTLGTHKTG